jgi:hypothetical protein
MAARKKNAPVKDKLPLTQPMRMPQSGRKPEPVKLHLVNSNRPGVYVSKYWNPRLIKKVRRWFGKYRKPLTVEEATIIEQTITILQWAGVSVWANEAEAKKLFPDSMSRARKSAIRDFFRGGGYHKGEDKKLAHTKGFDFERASQGRYRVWFYHHDFPARRLHNHVKCANDLEASRIRSHYKKALLRHAKAKPGIAKFDDLHPEAQRLTISPEMSLPAFRKVLATLTVQKNGRPILSCRNPLSNEIHSKSLDMSIEEAKRLASKINSGIVSFEEFAAIVRLPRGPRRSKTCKPYQTNYGTWAASFYDPITGKYYKGRGFGTRDQPEALKIAAEVDKILIDERPLPAIVRARGFLNNPTHIKELSINRGWTSRALQIVFGGLGRGKRRQEDSRREVESTNLDKPAQRELPPATMPTPPAANATIMQAPEIQVGKEKTAAGALPRKKFEPIAKQSAGFKVKEWWPWRKPFMALTTIASHVALKLGKSPRTIKEWAVFDNWRGNAPRPDERALAVEKNRVLTSLRQRLSARSP